VLRGGAAETYRPRFTWHGFRYVEVRGWPGGRPPLDAFVGEALHSAVEPAGAFASSSALLDSVQAATLRSQLSNMFSVQSDCPHRERFGYGGDMVAASGMALYNLDMAQFYAKAVRDFADGQRPNGGFPEIAPDPGIAVEGLGGGAGPVGWGTAHPHLAWELYRHYGDRRLLEEQYPNVRRWVAFLDARAREQGGILTQDISDHESLTPKPVALTATAFHAYNTRLAAAMARALGRAGEAAAYDSAAARIARTINARFLDPRTGRYALGTQAAQAFALALDLVPPAHQRAALQVLVDEVGKYEGHVSTGIFATRYLFEALTRHDRADLAYAAAAQPTFPGWGYMLSRGATTLWESWAYPEHVASQNHPMFGSVSQWFYEGLLGIAAAPDAVGFDRAVVRPNPVGDLTWARGHHRTCAGASASAWRVDAAPSRSPSRSGGRHRRRVRAGRSAWTTARGRPRARAAPGVRVVGQEGDRAHVRVGSGR
jgi:alpha-L-rhamnosidase